MDVESVYHDVGTIVDRRNLDHQRMVTGGEPVLPEDRHLVALDRVALAQPDFPYQDAVDVDVDDPAGARLAAADDAHRGPGEAEGDGRAVDVGGGGDAFAPDPGVVSAVPVRVGAVGDRRMV